MILFPALLFPRSSIHVQQPRFLNSWPITIDLHDTSSTAMMAVPPLLNGPLEVVTWLYLVIILLFLTIRLSYYICSFYGVFITTTIYLYKFYDIHSFVDHYIFKIYNLWWIGWSGVLHIPSVSWNMIFILSLLFPPLSWWPQSPRRFLLGFVSVVFGIPLWRCPGSCGYISGTLDTISGARFREFLSC